MNLPRLLFVLLAIALGPWCGAAPATLDDAVALYREKNYEAARSALESLHAAQPENPDVLYRLGQVYARQKRLDRAVPLLEHATQLAPANVEYLVALGDALGDLASEQSSLETATRSRETLERAVQLDPKNEDARVALIAFYRKAPAFAGGGMDKAYEQARELQSFSDLVGTRQLVQLMQREKRFDEAASTCAEALKRHVDDYSLLFEVGRIAAKSGSHMAEGIEALKRCLALPVPANQPTHENVHWMLGTIYAAQKEFAEARTHLDIAAKADPGNKDVQAALAALPPERQHP